MTSYNRIRNNTTTILYFFEGGHTFLTAKEICSHRLTIVTGHYGTGKTEFSVNLALALAGEGEQVMMADLDIGGDPVGARVLARFRPKILQEDHQLVYVLNANRPEVRAPENAIAYLRAIEATTGLTCGGIVNNTHLCGETTEHEIRKGADLAERVSEETGIPVLCHVAEERFADHLRDLREPVFPITIKMKKPWEL